MSCAAFVMPQGGIVKSSVAPRTLEGITTPVNGGPALAMTGPRDTGLLATWAAVLILLGAAFLGLSKCKPRVERGQRRH